MWIKHVTKKTGHILFPYLWHYFTDEYKDRLHHLVIDTLLSFVILLLLGSNIVLGAWWYLFSIEPQVDVTVTAPDLVISGESLALTTNLAIVNKTVDNVAVKLVLPPGFQTTNSLTHQWDHLPVGRTETISTVGQFTGNVQDSYRAIAVYTYTYYGQHFSGYNAVEFKVDTSSLEVVVNTPEQILNNESFTWTIDYYNSSPQDRTNVCITLDIPDNFISSTDRIVLATIPAQSGGQISLTGSFSQAIGEGNQVITVRGIDQCDRIPYQQVAIQQPIEVLTPRLNITTTGPSVVNVGDALHYTVTQTNAGDTTLDNITTTITATTGEKFSWQDGALAPGERRVKTLSLSIPASTRQKNLSIGYSASATATIADIGVTTYTTPVSGTSKFNSTLAISQSANYALGYGPYPLRAWDITAVRVFWQVADFTNDLTNVTLQATLPSQVEWTGHSAVTAGGAMSYDPGTRTVTWHSSSIPSFSHAQGASFEVRVLPNSDQVGKTINLTNDLRFSARDSFTGTVLVRTVGALRTDQVIQPEQ